jgi:calcineurin-like phosphoesterase family protein
VNYYMADPHFGHDNSIDFCKRPFHSTKQMDEAILANINARVKPDDDLWILGDFGFGYTANQDGYLKSIHERINCRTHLVIGNHDKENDRVLSLPWASVSPLVEMKDGTRHVTLCHYPMITWYRARRGAVMLFGHVHDGWLGSRNCINVGVDVWQFRPVRLAEAMKRGNKLPVNPMWSHVEHGSAAPGERA